VVYSIVDYNSSCYGHCTSHLQADVDKHLNTFSTLSKTLGGGKRAGRRNRFLVRFIPHKCVSELILFSISALGIFKLAALSSSKAKDFLENLIL